ncbi:MAG TPA: response regulator, partial [Leptospiraceae bacterium]|nr:response regulator [Leptospiraceae bacterium]
MKASILVIEDEVALRENICELLTLEGYGISEATDGIQGLEEAVQRHPDLILCDILMPRMNGKEFLAEARRRRELQDTPIVFLTALASSGEVRAGMNLGADDYITKPFSADDLIVTIETRLDRKRRSMQSIQSRVEKILWRFGDQTSADLNDPLNAIVLPARVLAERNQNLEKDDIRVLARGILNASSELSRNIDHLLWQQYLDQKIQSWQDDSFKLTTEWILSTLR